MDIEAIKALIRAAGEAGLSELTVRQDGATIRIRRGAADAPVPAPAGAAPRRPVSDGAAAPRAAADPAGVVVNAPLPGAFFRAQSPDDAPFVEAGATIEPGQTLALIEAMKTLTPVKAPARGIVRQIHAENGDAVDIDQPLFTLEETA